MAFEMQPLLFNPVHLGRLGWQAEDKEPLLLPGCPVLLGLPTAMKGSPILDDHGDLAGRLQMLLGLLSLPVHQGQIALGVETTHHETIVKADRRFPKP